MDEQRLERALRQGPPFATRYAPSSLALDEQPIVRAPSVGRLVLIIAVTGLLLVGILAGLTALGAFRTEEPAVDLGIFEPVAGRIVYGDRQGIWGVSPAAPTYPLMKVRLTSEVGIPLAWSSDGTQLLIMRGSRGEEHLFVLHADGSETQVTERQMSLINGATISPDGSRVVFAGDTSAFAGDSAIYAVDANGGQAEVLVEAQVGHVEEPTFSPDGTRIAYTDGNYDSSHTVWVMDADGTNAHEIVPEESTGGGGHVYGLAWSPTGDRIALGLEGATYTFAPDGSDLTRVISVGDFPYWSPDGSKIAYTISCDVGDLDGGCGFAIADADGSNELRFGTGASGPWHPGALEPL